MLQICKQNLATVVFMMDRGFLVFSTTIDLWRFEFLYLSYGRPGALYHFPQLTSCTTEDSKALFHGLVRVGHIVVEEDVRAIMRT